MRNPTGYSYVVEPDQPTVEYDNCTCGHCQRVIFVKPATASTVYLIFDRVAWRWREEMGAFCRVCMRPVCLACHALGNCTPWERRLEAAESRQQFCRQVGIGG